MAVKKSRKRCGFVIYSYFNKDCVFVHQIKRNAKF